MSKVVTLESLQRELQDLRRQLELERPAPMLINAAQAADLLGITRTAIYARVERGEIPGVVHIGTRTLRFDRDQLLTFIAEGRAPSLKGKR